MKKEHFRKAWPPKISKRFADYYITDELVRTYKAMAEDNIIYVSELMYGLLDLKGVLKGERRYKKIRVAKKTDETLYKWAENNVNLK